MKNNIYEEESYKNIIKNFKFVSFDEKYKIINYLFITGNIGEVFDLLKALYSTKLSKKELKKANYLQLIYHINKKDQFNIDSIKYKLIKENPKEKWFYDLVTEDDLNKKANIFKELVDSHKIYWLFMKKKYRKRIISLYLLNFVILDKPIKIRFIERYIIKTIKKLKNKKDYSIAEINYIEDICNIVFSGISYLYIKNNGYFINFVDLYQVINNIIISKEKYVDYTLNRKKEINSILYNSLRGIFNLNVLNSNDNMKLAEELDNFIERNYEEINDNIVITRKINNSNFFDMFEDILKNKKEDIDITELILIYTCNEYEKITEIYIKIEQMYNEYENNISQKMKNEIILAKEILNLWKNGRFDEEIINGKYMTSDFTSIIIKLFNGKISLHEFQEELIKIKNINCFEILNWYILEKKLKGNIFYDILSIILEKIDSEMDVKGKKYLENLYSRIFNDKMPIFLYDFIKINEIILKKFDDNYYFLINSVNILYYLFEDFNTAGVLAKNIVEKWEEIKIVNKEKYLLDILFILIEKGTSNVEFNKINTIINRTELYVNKNLLYLYMSIRYKEISFSQTDYRILLKYILELYKNINNIADVEYKMIANIAVKYLENKLCIDISEHDYVYYKNNKHYHLKEDDKLLMECYKILEIEETTNIENGKKESILMFLICRIFFEKIEEKGIGKKILLPTNANAKEIITELNNAIGFDKIMNQKNKIREGKLVDTTWLNIYEFNSIFEDIVSSKSKMFFNSSNKRFLSKKKILHFSSILLLCKLDRLDIIEKNECYISNEVYTESIKRNNKEIKELGRGILEEAICYDEYLDKLVECLCKIKRKNRIFTVTEANILPRSGINKYDDEIMKIIVDSTRAKDDVCLITEDPFFLKQYPFSDISEGTVSLLIDSYMKQLISPQELYESIEKLEKMNYNLDLGNTLYSFLLSKSDDEYIKKIISIVNKYKINKNKEDKN